MKKAVVVGGSNGIGLAITRKLIERDFHVIIFDIKEPDESVLTDNSTYTYRKFNLLDFYVEPFKNIVNDASITVLIITAGFGRCTLFDNINIGEINNIITVNTISTIKIIKLFYDRINNTNDFYCGVMGSIAGFVNSPLFSVYAASKAAVCRFIESINVELEKNGVVNRITNISPGSIKGTRFNGATSNNYELTANLAEECLKSIMAKELLYIPEYDNIYNNVIKRNYKDSHRFGLESYEYKIASGRYDSKYKGCIGYLSGTFDLFHIGHLNILKRAKSLCDYLVVGVHPDASHKGKETFIPFDERKEIVRGIRYVDEVITSFPEDSDAWNIVHYNKLFVGSDYKGTERFNNYERFFKDKDVEIVYFPYTQGTSSTQIRNTILDRNNKIIIDTKKGGEE